MNTTLFKPYVHPTGTEIDNEIVRVYKLVESVEKQKEVYVITRKFSLCKRINPPVSGCIYACEESFNPISNDTEEQIQRIKSCHGKELFGIS